MNTPHIPETHDSHWLAVRHGVLAGLAMLALLAPPGILGPGGALASAPVRVLPQATAVRSADLGGVEVSDDARLMAHWIASTGDHTAMPFVLIDKRAARLYVFDAQARLVDNTAVLLGSAPGDDSVPGIGDKPIALVLPQERTTPAGRFAGQRGLNLDGEDVVWVDYDAAVSMHRVRANNPKERRLERLASDTADDNRISYGCINIPASFFDAHIATTFANQRAMVYVLPEQKSLQTVFGVPSQGHLAQMIK
ncbi:MAG: hypothetical protein U1E02_04660 [Hydrogenophaga sp.]|uniref:hypothetical protein n=1 Tax=Hydrogenophaga sp. TaxID=1904254 RepID=UPI00271D681F|nr:hypothetical protein [Hydrogenophaga sp.]MDO8889808.1 hypothetical protein [Hydrogenophaga sp.]MDP2251096.1 hypothetical protein [Hydrogenophaga sp.]MDZ4123458.1 hypothetical protein [Hydrogenophaga sp.]